MIKRGMCEAPLNIWFIIALIRYTHFGTPWAHDHIMNHTTAMINRADGSRLSQLPQCLQHLGDCEDFPQSHSPFMFYLIYQNNVHQKYNHVPGPMVKIWMP